MLCQCFLFNHTLYLLYQATLIYTRDVLLAIHGFNSDRIFLSLASVHTLKHGFVIVGSIQYFAKTAFTTTEYTTGSMVVCTHHNGSTCVRAVGASSGERREK